MSSGPTSTCPRRPFEGGQHGEREAEGVRPGDAGLQIFKLNIVMTAITILAIVSSMMYLAISAIEAAVMRRR